MSTKDGSVDVTRAEYNEAFGAEVPDVPVVPLDHVWEWFWALNARRQSGFDSPNPISYEQVHSWSTLTRTIITPSEVELLMAMDDAFLEQGAIERAGKREREKERQNAESNRPKTRRK